MLASALPKECWKSRQVRLLDCAEQAAIGPTEMHIQRLILLTEAFREPSRPHQFQRRNNGRWGVQRAPSQSDSIEKAVQSATELQYAFP